MNKLLAALLLAAAPLAHAGASDAGASKLAVPHGWKIVDRIPIGGDTRWDLMQLDPAAHRLYVSHGSQTEVIDTRTDKLVGTIADTHGVHGIAIASELGRGFTSDGKDDALTEFDLATLKPLRTIKVGANPDVVVYDPATRRVLSFNGHSKDVSVVDAEHGTVVGTVAVGGKPELAVLARDGHVWFNVEDTGELAEFDPKAMKIASRRRLAGCEEPTGLAVDDRGRFYSGCGNKAMVVSGADGARLGSATIGAGVDGVAWQDGFAFSANGADGTISVVEEDPFGHFVTAWTVATALGARTIVGDAALHRLYLPTAEFKPAAEGQRPVAVPGSAVVLVVEKY